jgi:uncharacterized phage-associated protein
MWQHMHLIIDQQLHNNMETQYHTLNKKLDALSNNKSGRNKQKTNKFQPKVINLSNTHLTKEQIDILYLGHSYAIEKEPKKYINELIIDTEVAIRQLEPNIQNTYRHLAAKQIKQILNSNRHNTHHKRQQYSINQIKKILESNNLTLVKADKSKAEVIMNKENLEEKVNSFIKENGMKPLNKDHTDTYQKQIQKNHPR